MPQYCSLCTVSSDNFSEQSYIWCTAPCGEIHERGLQRACASAEIPRDLGPTDSALLYVAGLAPVETLSLKDLTLKL